MGVDILNAQFAGFFMARVFGVISPKISRIMVMMTVMMVSVVAKLVIPREANNSRKKAVANDVAAMLAKLFPIKIHVNSFLGCCNRNSRCLASFLFLFNNERSFIRLVAVNAVSALEKKADNPMNKIKIKLFKISISINLCVPSHYLMVLN